MERRLKLHEKLKSTTKLNKMTVKQGDLLVTLNLRQDICDPNVEISDKVLYMLEQFVEKQQSKLLTTTISSIKSPEKTADADTAHVNKLRRNTSQSVSPSPSKRVRFDLNPNYHEIMNDDNSNNDVNSLSETNSASEETSDHEKSNQSKIVTFSKRIEDYLNRNETEKISNDQTSIVDPEPAKSNDQETTSTQNEPILNFSSNSKTVSNGQSKSFSDKQTHPKLAKNDDKSHKTKQKKTSSLEEDQEEDEEQNYSFNCRLCRLKFTNQRGLHEHVARIHGGKGGSFNLSLFADQDEDYDDTNYDDDNVDDDDEDETNDPFDFNKSKSNRTSSSNNTSSTSSNNNSKKHIWNNQFKKKKLPTSSLPHPNVAIRVAKVAYYNSKIGQSNNSESNAFKSAIFKSGGIRGNFFSQERLPLRSCKIKMKLTSSSEHNDLDETDKFLSSINVLDDFKSVDRNTAITYQTANLSNENEDILTEQEARAFFKSLLVYLPWNTSTDVMRLDDLIKLSQESEEGLLNNKLLTDSLKLLHELILDSKQFGITLYDLKKGYTSRMGTDALKMNIITVLLQLLIDNFLVLAVGVVKRVYVAHEFKQHWVIESCKNQKGRGFSSQESEINNELTNEVNEDTDLAESVEQVKTTRNSLRKIEKKPDESTYPKQFKPVCLIPRPWRYIDGLLNRPVLQKMFETILIYLKSYPNATLDTISEHFCPVLQPIMTLELLEMLEKCKCIGKTYLKKEASCSLFSDFQNTSTCVRNDEDLDGDEITCYHCKPNSIFTIKKIFQS